ncbi:MAG: SPOR domain-containing protein [Steroidobacteraceae bacterium]
MQFRDLLRQNSIRRAGALLAALAALAAHAPATAAGALPGGMPVGQLVQVVDTEEHEDHADINVQFACSARYIANMPLNHGNSTRITLRLGPDCGGLLGSFPPEFPLVGGGGQLVTGARVESNVPGEVTLELSWSRDLDFVMAPTASDLGLRLRLIGTGHKKASVYTAEPEAPQGYAVNLESSESSFDRGAVETAAARLQTQAYVSETDIEDQHWYRLRAGPFTTRQEAERVLSIALSSYPRAWLATNDEATDLAVVERAGVPSAAVNTPTDPPLPDDERAAILREARNALEKRQYPQAIALLTRLLRQPEYPARVDAQELMGLVRERAGQLALAKAEDEAYLSRYPDGPGAARVRSRLKALAAASLAPKSTGEFGAPANNRWTVAGSVALAYQYGKEQTVSSGTSTTTTAVNGALAYADVLIRDRGARYDFTARADAGYTQNLVTSAGGNQDRTTAAFVELTDHTLGLSGRLGRQSLASQGVIGLFDGLFVGYQIDPKFSVSAAAGYPVYTSYSAFSTQQQFETVTLEYSPFRSWIFDTYLFNQTDEGATGRRSLGFQTRYSEPGRTAILLGDYDIAFNQLNSLTLIGNLGIGRSWVLGFDADHRRSPLLELSNALIGQSAPDLNTLEHEFTPSQIRQMALDRTATSDTFTLSASRPFGERWQVLADVAALRLSGTPASFGVDATTSTGLDKSVTLQLSGSSLMQASDLHIFGVRFDDSPMARSTTLSWDARFALPGAWRFGPRFAVEQLNDPSLGGKQMLYLPELRADWTSRRSVFEIIGGYQLQTQQAVLQQQTQTGQAVTGTLDQRSLYISATYRLRF